jgi:hypothetical protein
MQPNLRKLSIAIACVWLSFGSLQLCPHVVYKDLRSPSRRIINNHNISRLAFQFLLTNYFLAPVACLISSNSITLISNLQILIINNF